LKSSAGLKSRITFYYGTVYREAAGIKKFRDEKKGRASARPELVRS